MSYKEQQRQWLRDNHVEVGTRAKIAAGLREGNQYETELFGWDVDWNKQMTETVGREGVVTNIHQRAIKVLIPGHSENWYPYFVLETVGDPQLESAIAEFQSETA